MLERGEPERYKISDHTIKVIARALDELERSGKVGSDALVYLATLLRRFDNPLNAVTLSDSPDMQPSHVSSTVETKVVLTPSIPCPPTKIEPDASHLQIGEVGMDREDSPRLCETNADETRGEEKADTDLSIAEPDPPCDETRNQEVELREQCGDGAVVTDLVSHEEHAPVSTPNTNHTVLIIGGPGSGKGTICERLISDYHFTHLSVGELLRAEVAAQTSRGLEVESIMKAGLLVPDDLVMEMVTSHISQSSASVLLDGFPRTLKQAQSFNVTPSLILWLDCEDEILINRILERAKHSGREDDNLETVTERIKTFKSNAEPILHYYSQPEHGHLVTIDGSKSVDEVYAQVDKTVRSILNNHHDNTV